MTTSILTRRYTSSDRKDWNNFIEKAKNSTFLFNRDYVDYHQDRFRDHSLLIYSGNELSALLIASESGDRIESHGGLTYGGLILEVNVRLERVLQFFHHAVKYYHSNGFRTIVYKCLPSYLANYPSNEDLYALFLLNATLIRRETSMVLCQTKPVEMQRRVSKSSKIYRSGDYDITASDDPARFWNDVLTPNLGQRHGAEPVHSVPEMKLLMDRFPGNIRLFEVYDNELVAGAVVYVMPHAAHLQYISSNVAGREGEASGVLIHYLIKDVYPDKEYFSFGTSNSEAGRQLNKGLASWKEGFGARTFVHDFYEVETANYELLAGYE